MPELTLFYVISHLQIIIDIQPLDVDTDDDPHMWLVHHDKNWGEYNRVMLGIPNLAQLCAITRHMANSNW